MEAAGHCYLLTLVVSSVSRISAALSASSLPGKSSIRLPLYDRPAGRQYLLEG